MSITLCIYLWVVCAHMVRWPLTPICQQTLSHTLIHTPTHALDLTEIQTIICIHPLCVSDTQTPSWDSSARQHLKNKCSFSPACPFRYTVSCTVNTANNGILLSWKQSLVTVLRSKEWVVLISKKSKKQFGLQPVLFLGSQREIKK